MSASKPKDSNNNNDNNSLDDVEIARFENTFQLDSANPFNVLTVEAILQRVLREALSDLAYDASVVSEKAKWASGVVKDEVKALQFDR